MKHDTEYNRLEEQRDRAREQYAATHSYCEGCGEWTLDIEDHPINLPRLTFRACAECGEEK